jgi:hypothetical protein
MVMNGVIECTEAIEANWLDPSFVEGAPQKINELFRIKEGIIPLCPLPRKSVHGHVGHCRVTDVCTATCPEDFPKK